jgi:hypothetical protein
VKIFAKKEGQGREDNLGSRVVKDLTRKITDKGHHVYMDNFFSNPTLFEELAKETIYCCGTAQVEYCILIWSALSTPNINLLYAVATLGHGTSFKVPSFCRLRTVFAVVGSQLVDK